MDVARDPHSLVLLRLEQPRVELAHQLFAPLERFLGLFALVDVVEQSPEEVGSSRVVENDLRFVADPTHLTLAADHRYSETKGAPLARLSPSSRSTRSLSSG